jgi:hypothetical protein
MSKRPFLSGQMIKASSYSITALATFIDLCQFVASALSCV